MNKKLTDQELDNMLSNYCARRTQLAFDAPMEKHSVFSTRGFRYAAATFTLVAVFSAGIFSSYLFKDGDPAKPQNSFVITASAAEVLTDTEFTPIGKLAPQLMITGYPEDDSKNSAPYYVGGVLDTDIKCDGSNIEKLTYSISNATFIFDKTDSTIYDIKSSGKKSFRKAGGEVYWDIKKDEYGYHASLNINGKGQGGAVTDDMKKRDLCSEFTVDYKNREKVFEDGSGPLSTVAILGGYCNNSQTAMSEQELFENMVNDVTISIKATYTDGTAETKTLRLNCNYINGSSNKISAILEK